MVTRAVQFFVSYIVSDGSSAQGDKETEDKETRRRRVFYQKRPHPFQVSTFSIAHMYMYFHAGHWCDALRRVIKEGYRHVMSIHLCLIWKTLRKTVKIFHQAQWCDELIAAFSERTPISPLPRTPPRRNTTPWYQLPLATVSNPSTPGGHFTPLSPLPQTPPGKTPPQYNLRLYHSGEKGELKDQD